ncbi:MAG: hypothetical protein M1830_004020 [Pleopsidium flavum]|nr:MAG: hypothetical protein M1830_004020 [Pleopsidium flavum]
MAPFTDFGCETVQKGTVAERIQAFNNGITTNAASHQSLRTRPSLTRLASIARGASREENSRVGYGRRDAASFAAPAARASVNDKPLERAIAETVAKSPTHHGKAPPIREGSAVAMRLEKGLKGLVVVGPKTRVQVDAASPWAYIGDMKPKSGVKNACEVAKPDQKVGGRVRASIKPARVFPEQKQVQRSIDEVLEMVDGMLKEHKRTADVGAVEGRVPGADFEKIDKEIEDSIRSMSASRFEAQLPKPDFRFASETPASYNSSSDHSSSSLIHREPPKYEARGRQKQRHRSTSVDTILPRTSSDIERCHDFCPSSRSTSTSSSSSESSAHSNQSEPAILAKNSGGGIRLMTPHGDGSWAISKSRHHYHYHHYLHWRVKAHKHGQKHPPPPISKSSLLKDTKTHEPTKEPSSLSSPAKSESRKPIEPTPLTNSTPSTPTSQTSKQWRWWKLALVDKQSPGKDTTQQAV